MSRIPGTGNRTSKTLRVSQSEVAKKAGFTKQIVFSIEILDKTSTLRNFLTKLLVLSG